MGRAGSWIAIRWWEYVVYIAVTIPLLLIGVVLWFFGLFIKLVQLFRWRRTND